jgi:hypothetical protein
MTYRSILAALAVLAAVGSAHAAGIKGQYIEARTCDVWTGPCFANAEMHLGGRHAVLGWKVESGSLDGVKLDGLGIVAVIEASDTLGQEQSGKGKAVLIVDKKASKAQQAALVKLARQQGGKYLANVVAVETATVELEACPCKNNACAVLKAGTAQIETRCLNDKHDKICGNESAFYPPLSQGVKVTAALTVKHAFSGKGVGGTWNESGRRASYVGTFEVR